MVIITLVLDLDDRLTFSSGKLSKALTYNELSSDFSNSELLLVVGFLLGISVFSSSCFSFFSIVTAFSTAVTEVNVTVALLARVDTGCLCNCGLYTWLSALDKILSKFFSVEFWVTPFRGWETVIFLVTFFASLIWALIVLPIAWSEIFFFF